MIPNLIEIYCFIENFTKKCDEIYKKTNVGRKSCLTKAEYITLMIVKQSLQIKQTKNLYNLLKCSPSNGFGPLPSYQQFCEGIQSTIGEMLFIMQMLAQINLIQTQEKEFIVDATKLDACKTINYKKCRKTNINASSGKTLEGWFFGYKLHMIINTNMDIVAFKFTTGSVADITALTSNLVKNIQGKLVADKGYLSQEKTAELLKQGLLLFTKTRKNMKKLPISKKLLQLLCKRSCIENAFGQLKDNLSLINTKCRSIITYFVHVIGSMIAYSLKSKSSLLELDVNYACSIIS